MGMPVLIYGKSGSGKSRSLKEFAEDEIFLVNVERKYLPFRKKFKYTYESDDAEKIKAGLKKMPTKTAVIDDAGYILTNIFMRGNSKKKTGGDVFDLYNRIGYEFWSLFEYIKTDLPKDVIVYIIMHDEADDYGNTKLKMLGKILEQKVCIEGMVTICLRCIADEKGHHFLTNTDGSDITKSPEEMFTEKVIDNDLKFVDDTIRKYYEI